MAAVMFVVLFDTSKVLASLARLEPWVMLAAAAGIVAAFRVRALRWMLLLRPVQALPYGQVRDVLLTGFMVNNVLPARAGEVARALVLWRIAGTSRRATLTTVAMERLVDVAMLVGILSLVGLVFEVPPWARGLGTLTSALLVCIAGAVAWMAFHHASLFRAVDAALFFVPAAARARLLGFMERFVDGTRALRDARLLAGVLACSVVVWAMEVGVYLLVMRGIGLELPAWSAAFVVVVANFGIAAPSAPGYVGTFDAACSAAVVALGGDATAAISFALALHVVFYVVVTGNGLWAMWRLELKLGDVGRGRPGDSAGARAPEPPA